MAAGVEGRLEDRLQDLEHGLLNHPIHHVGNAKPPLPASGLWQPDPANVAGPIAFRQQVMTQRGDERRSVALCFLDRLSVHSRRTLVAYHLQQRLCQIGDRRYFFQQPTVSAVQATVRAVFLGFAVCSRKARPPDTSGVPVPPPPCGLSAKAKLI